MSEISREFVERIERVFFRTHQDIGANANTLIVWNRVREAAGLVDLTTRDLMLRAADEYHASWRRAVTRGREDHAGIALRAEEAVLTEIKEYDRGGQR